MFTGLSFIGGTELVLYLLTHSNSINHLLSVLSACVVAFGALIASHWLGRTNRKYREYNLIDFELEIINAVFDQTAKMDSYKDD